MSIKIKNLNYIYNPSTVFEVKALDNINLEINDGEFIGIIGHTGSGKSTLIQHFNGLLKATSGSISINGMNFDDKKSLLEIRKKVGLVFQNPEYQLFEESVEKDVAFGPTNLGYDEREVEQLVTKALNSVGMNTDEVRKASPFDLSGGQKRRVAIAGVLSMNPEVLILDEPTSALDPKTRRSIMDMIYTEHRNSNRITILVSHSMEEIAKYVDRIIVLENGKIKYFDKAIEVFKHENELNKIGLDIPEITKIIRSLNEKGFNISEGIYDLNALSEAIIKEIKC